MRIRPALTWRRPLWQLYLAGGALATALYSFVPPFKSSGPLINLLGLSGVIAVVVGIRRHRPSRLSWWLFALGLFLFWAGDVYTYSYPRLFHVQVPFPSPGDAVYIAVYPVLMAGLILLIRRRNPERDRNGMIDSVIITLGLALVSWITLIAPYVHDPTLSLLPKLVSVAYPLGDILLLAAAVRLAVDGGSRRPALYLLALSIITLLVTDFVYGVMTLDGTYNHQIILDVGWIAFYLFWGAAALHPSMRELENPSADRRPRLTWTRLAALSGATLIAPGIEIVKEISRHDVDLVTTIAVSAVLFTLVVMRMAGLIRQREQHLTRERILAAAARDIVAATSREQICVAALAAVPTLVGAGASARIAILTDDRADVIALEPGADHRVTTWPVDQEDCPPPAAAPDTEDIPGLSPLSAQQREALRLSSDVPTILSLGLSLRGDGRSRGLLLVSGEKVGSQTVVSALVSLGTQLSLAMESSALTEELHRRSSEARFGSLVANTHDLITVLDATSTIVYQSPSIERALGVTAEEVHGTSFTQLLEPAQNSRLVHLLGDCSAGEGGGSELIECTLRHRGGGTRQFEIRYTNLLHDPAVKGIVLNGRDISERKAFEQQLEHQAFHDPVTQLANRALLNERARHALARIRREGTAIGVIFLDLDDFKTINDSLGHAAGDRVLMEVAKRLAGCIRVSDTAARFGGDEFALLLEDINGPQEVADTAERILTDLKRPVDLEGKEIAIRASLGIAVSEAGSAAGADELIRNADAAMYIAKRDGKGSYRLFEPAMHSDVLARLELRADLQRALVNDELELHYQPVMRLDDGAVIGLEALVRWAHPERGLIPPADFIPFAEETGLIVPLGRWVLREGCRQAKLIDDTVVSNTRLTMNINLSVNQLHNSDIVSDVRDALAEAQLDPSLLTLEITETVMMSDADLAEQRLSELKALGVRIALDDFGTGYSSLGYLSRFPVDIIKMDRSFLSAGASPVTSGLATAVIGLGKTFELAVVAEGIEYGEQWATLRQLGCELGQGFLFSKPMDSGATIDYLHKATSPVAATKAVGPDSRTS